MNKKVEAYRVFNGTHTAVWIDSERHYEINSVQAKVTYDKEEITLCDQFMSDYLTTGGKGSGSIGIYKTDSSNIDLFDEDYPNARHEIVFKVDTPDAAGAERIRLTGVTFDEITLADYQAKKAGQVTIPFTFVSYKLLDRVEASI